MSKVKNENFIAIQGWMVTELGLKGNSLLIYAIIYGFSQDGEQVFNGSLQYLADWTNSTKQSVINCLKKLVDDGLLGKNEKNINGVKFVEYYSKKLNGVLNKVEWGIKQSLPNNIEDNIEHNINKERKKADSYDSVFENKKVDGKLKETFVEFIKSRKLNGKKMTDKALELAIDKVRKLGRTEDEQVRIIEQSIANSWQGIFPLKEETKSNEDLLLLENDENIRCDGIIEFWEKILGYKPLQTRTNMAACRQLLKIDGEDGVKKLIVALRMRSEHQYLSSEIKKVADFESLLKNRSHIWGFYTKYEAEWRKWQENAQQGKQRWEI